MIALQTIVTHPLPGSPVLFYLLGYIGIVLYILRGALKLGTTLDVFAPFVKANALSIIATIVTYDGIMGMWQYTDAFSFFGLDQGELNGMSITVAFMANELFQDLVEKQKEKLAKKGPQLS